VKALLSTFPALCAEDARRIRTILRDGHGLSRVDREFGDKLGSFGREVVEHGRTESSLGFVYLNVGDPYSPTIIKKDQRRAYYIGCWGTIVEHGNYE
jgi:hypothetical protein